MSGFPPVDQVTQAMVNEAVQAEIRIAKKRIGWMLEGGAYMPPDPLHNLRLHLALALEAYDDGARSGVAQDRLEALRVYADGCARLLSLAGCETVDRAVPRLSAGQGERGGG